MKKMTVLIAAVLALSTPLASLAVDHGSMKMDHDSHQGDVAHEEVVNGVKATFKVMSMKEHMKAMKMELPKEMKETHHIAVEFKDAKTGKALTEGEVTVKPARFPARCPSDGDHDRPGGCVVGVLP